MTKEPVTLDSPPHHFTAGSTAQYDGVTTYFLAPNPLPTGTGTGDAEESLRGIETEAILEFNGPRTTAFQWTIWLTFLWVCAYAGLGIPFIGYLMVGGFWEGVAYMFWKVFLLFCLGAVFFIPDKTRWGMKRTLNKLRPIVFNRQKRQVWVTMDDGTAQCFSWEMMGFAISEIVGATQHGVHRQATIMLVFRLPKDQCHTVEYSARHPLTALSTWETLRAWMEYEIDEVRTLDPYYTEGDPPWEGRHTFRRKRQQLHQDYRDGKVSLALVIGWYAFRLLLCGWDITYRWAEIDGRRFEKVRSEGHGCWSKELLQWADPIPKEEWEKPSSMHAETCRRVRARLGDEPRLNFDFVRVFHEERSKLYEEVAAVYGEDLEGFDPVNHQWDTEVNQSESAR